MKVLARTVFLFGLVGERDEEGGREGVLGDEDAIATTFLPLTGVVVGVFSRVIVGNNWRLLPKLRKSFSSLLVRVA